MQMGTQEVPSHSVLNTRAVSEARAKAKMLKVRAKGQKYEGKGM